MSNEEENKIKEIYDWLIKRESAYGMLYAMERDECEKAHFGGRMASMREVINYIHKKEGQMFIDDKFNKNIISENRFESIEIISERQMKRYSNARFRYIFI